MGGPLDGAILFFGGYFLIWASVLGLIQRPVPVPLMCLFIFMAAQGQNFFNTTNVVTRLINFWRLRRNHCVYHQRLYWSEWSSADPSVGNNMLGQSKHLYSVSCTVSDSRVPFAYASGSNLWHNFT